jgi:hypothetical protein
LAGFYRNGLADIRAARELTRDTAKKLRTIGKVLGASPDTISLQGYFGDAGQATVLSDYRIVHFATTRSWR